MAAVLLITTVGIGLLLFTGGQQRIQLAAQSIIYGNVPSLRGCEESPTKAQVEAMLARENPFLSRDDIYDAGAWSLDECPDHAHIRVDFAGVAARKHLESYLGKFGEWDPLTGWSWRGIPVSLINV